MELPHRVDAKLNSLQAVEIIKNLVSLGADEATIGSVFGVEECTIEQWKQRYPIVKDAIKSAEKVANSLIISKLISLAIGNEYDITEKWPVHINSQDDELVDQPARIKYVTKRKIPPNVDLLKFYLINRLGWRDTRKQTDLIPPIPDECGAIDNLGKKFTENKEVFDEKQV